VYWLHLSAHLYHPHHFSPPHLSATPLIPIPLTREHTVYYFFLPFAGEFRQPCPFPALIPTVEEEGPLSWNLLCTGYTCLRTFITRTTLVRRDNRLESHRAWTLEKSTSGV
jgi:hypothetical protein